MSRCPSVLCCCSACASIANLCGAPTRNAPKSPALWESGIVALGVVPNCPRNGRIRVTTPTRSLGAKVNTGFWTLLSGSAAYVAASRANSSARALSTDTPSRPSNASV